MRFDMIKLDYILIDYISWLYLLKCLLVGLFTNIVESLVLHLILVHPWETKPRERVREERLGFIWELAWKLEELKAYYAIWASTSCIVDLR